MNRSHKILSKKVRGVQKVNTFQPRAFHTLRTIADRSSQRAPNASRRPNPWPLVILPEVPRAPTTPYTPALCDLTLYLNPSLMRCLLPYDVGHKGCQDAKPHSAVCSSPLEETFIGSPTPAQSVQALRTSLVYTVHGSFQQPVKKRVIFWEHANVGLCHLIRHSPSRTQSRKPAGGHTVM